MELFRPLRSQLKGKKMKPNNPNNIKQRFKCGKIGWMLASPLDLTNSNSIQDEGKYKKAAKFSPGGIGWFFKNLGMHKRIAL